MKLFVVEPDGSGGMIHYAYQLCTALADNEVDVTLVTAQEYELEGYPHNFEVRRQMNLWTHYDLGSGEGPVGPVARVWRRLFRFARRLLRGLRLFREWAALTNYLLRQRPDIVQFSHIHFPFEALFLARLRRGGLTLTQICHEFELRERTGTLYAALKALYAGAYKNFSAMFLHGEANRQRFLSLFDVAPHRTHIIPHGNENLFLTFAPELEQKQDFRVRYGIEADEPVVLFFGHLTPSKGLPDLLRAFAIVRRNSSAKLLVAGFPSKHIDVSQLERIVEDANISEAVIFDSRYIPVEEVGHIIELATVIAFPYRNGTASGSLQLAYAYGRPVVATRVGNLSEVVEDGRSGYLVPPQAPEALAQALLRVVEDTELAGEMGAYARHLSETRYSWKPIAGQILAVYRDVLGSPPETRAID